MSFRPVEKKVEEISEGSPQQSNGVLTTYEMSGEMYGSYILGEDMARIKLATEKRNMGEKIESGIFRIPVIEDYSLLTDQEFSSRLPEILHTCCYVAFIAYKSGNATIADLLGDRGLIHEIAHLLQMGQTPETTVNDVKQRFCEFKRLATGLYEPV